MREEDRDLKPDDYATLDDFDWSVMHEQHYSW